MSRTFNVNLDHPMKTIHAEFSRLSAASVAELFLSPHIDPLFVNQATAEEGPSLWIVNRSDVYNTTLETLTTHPIPSIAARAKEKFSLRRSTLILLSPPALEGPLHEIPEYQIEDVLGHPLVPFEAVMYFTDHSNDDYRASAALSLTRRLLEHPPNWSLDLPLKHRLIDTFSKLLMRDSSPLVRSYAARIPLFPESILTEAWAAEKHALVRGRILQNPASPERALASVGKAYQDDDPEDLFLARIAAIDRRCSRELRQELCRDVGDSSRDPLSFAIHLQLLNFAS